jgi:hypothetical protein
VLAAVGKASSHDNQTMRQLSPLHGLADFLERLIAKLGSSPRHVKAASEQVTDLYLWGFLVLRTCDFISPVIGSSRPLPGFPVMGYPPDLG